MKTRAVRHATNGPSGIFGTAGVSPRGSAARTCDPREEPSARADRTRRYQVLSDPSTDGRATGRKRVAGTVIGRRSTKGPARPVNESRRAREKRSTSRERYFLLAASRIGCVLNSDLADGLATCATASDTNRSSSAANKRRAVRHAKAGPSGMQNV